MTDSVWEGYTWPEVVLVAYRSSIWKVTRVRPWGSKELVKLKDFDRHAIDIESVEVVWVWGDWFTFTYRAETVPIQLCRPLKPMEIIALAARDDFPMERALTAD